jgi:hypothetical protein
MNGTVHDSVRPRGLEFLAPDGRAARMAFHRGLADFVADELVALGTAQQGGRRNAGNSSDRRLHGLLRFLR